MTDQRAMAPAAPRGPGRDWGWMLAITLGPPLAALVLGGLVLLAMGVNPLE